MYILICTHASPLPPPPKARRGSKASSPPLRLPPFYSQLIGGGGVPPPSPLLIFMIKGSERGGKKPFPTSIFLSLICSRTLSLGLSLCRLLSQAPPFTLRPVPYSSKPLQPCCQPLPKAHFPLTPQSHARADSKHPGPGGGPFLLSDGFEQHRKSIFSENWNPRRCPIAVSLGLADSAELER